MRRILSVMMIFALGLCGGCAGKYGEQTTQPNYYPTCYQPIQDLRQSENTVNKSTAGGALLGAFTGAVIGLLATGGKWQGAVVGGATGGVAGTMAGNLYGRKMKEKDDNIRLASYLQDLDGDISNLDVAGAAARTSLQCYDRQFNSLLAAIRAKQVTRDVAARRFAEISSGREEAIAILGNAAQYGANLSQEYENAFVSEQQQLNTPTKTQQTAARQQNANTLQQARKRKTTLVNKTQALSAERKRAVETSSQQTREINEAYAALQDIRS